MIPARVAVLVAMLVSLAACGGGGQGRIVFEIQLQGLRDLGQGGHYEGWAVVAGRARSTGKFVIDESQSPASVNSLSGRSYGTVESAIFGPSNTRLGTDFPFIQDATRFFVTIEATGDPDSAPSGNVIVAGAFSGSEAILSAGEAIAPLDTASGVAMLAAPTGTGAAQDSGVWFVDPTASAGSGPSLQLPLLSGDWRWEAWVDGGNGDFLSLGRFLDPGAPDDDASWAPTRGSDSIGFSAPGQDFITPALVGETPVLDLGAGGWRVVVTVEAQPDNDLKPSALRILEVAIPPDAVGANGVGQDAFDLVATTGLPSLEAAVAPGSVVLSGTPPGFLGAPSAGHYSLWAVISNSPVFCGSFRPDASGNLLSSPFAQNIGSAASFSFDASSTQLGAAFPPVETASEFFITLEFQGLHGPTPSPRVLLAGAVSASVAQLSLEGLSASGGRGLASFAGVSGAARLRSPTNPSDPADDQRGIWFQTTAGGASLQLPALPDAWRYEGWVENSGSGESWSLGRFRRGGERDEDAVFWAGRGSELGPAVPGQDFLVFNPAQPINPLSLLGRGVRLSVEPGSDPDPAPFLFVLEGTAPQTPLQAFNLSPLPNLVAGLPSGRVSFRP